MAADWISISVTVAEGVSGQGIKTGMAVSGIPGNTGHGLGETRGMAGCPSE